MLELRTLTPSVIRASQHLMCSRRREKTEVPDVEMGSFTPLVFGTNGGTGNECQRFLKQFTDKIAQKDSEPYHIVITWLRTQISFELSRSVHACVRGSRTPFRSNIEQFLSCKINVASADIWNFMLLHLGRFKDTYCCCCYYYYSYWYGSNQDILFYFCFYNFNYIVLST